MTNKDKPKWELSPEMKFQIKELIRQRAEKEGVTYVEACEAVTDEFKREASVIKSKRAGESEAMARLKADMESGCE